jgi:hypothetical protein
MLSATELYPVNFGLEIVLWIGFGHSRPVLRADQTTDNRNHTANTDKWVFFLPSPKIGISVFPAGAGVLHLRHVSQNSTWRWCGKYHLPNAARIQLLSLARNLSALLQLFEKLDQQVCDPCKMQLQVCHRHFWYASK